MQTNHVVSLNVSSEIQAHAERTELDSDSADVRATLNDGKGELATGQEAGLLAVNGEKIWLRQNLKN